MKSGNRQTRLNPAFWVERAKKGTTSRPNGFRDVFLARSGNSSTRSGEQARRRATLESELRRCRAWTQVTQVGGLHAHQDRTAGLWRASCRSWRTRRSTSGCSWTCVARRGGGKKMARSRFTDILNAFISGGDRRGEQRQSKELCDWLLERRPLIGRSCVRRFHTADLCCAIT